MNLIKRFMGRRQFLMTAGAASTCALVCKKIAGFQTDVAMAEEKGARAGVNVAANKCPNLLSPLRIRNVVLKNRIMHPVSPTHLLQGPENFPADAYRNHYSNMAKNAAVVTINTHFGKYPKTYSPGAHGPSANFSDDIWEDIPPVHNYVERMIDDIHSEGALIHYDGPTGGGGGPETQEQAPTSIKDIVDKAKEAEDLGYDVYKIDVNTTTLKAAEAIRSATNLIIMGYLGVGNAAMGMESQGSGKNTHKIKWNYDSIEYNMIYGENTPGITNRNQPTESELEQAVEAAKRFEGLADFVWIRDGSRTGAWVQDKERPYALACSEAIKDAGVKIITCPGSGLHYADLNEEFIASGKCDMVAMATPLFADPEFVKKASEGRTEDIIPCISCQNCHGISMTKGPWYQVCTVNPKWATPGYKLQNIPAPSVKKKVAVIGGGPAGMQAAIIASERGHRVTLYEKETSLGGLLKFTDYTQWKWSFKDFKDYLVTQVNKSGIEVRVNTTATPDMIKAKGYDTVLVATGAEPVTSKMPGADAGNVFNIVNAYSNKKALGKNVVIIGAGRIGTETGIGLAKDGHKVTVITSGKDLIESELIGPHNEQEQMRILEFHPNFDCALEATVESITGGKVIYRDSKGSKKSIQTDGVVIYSGLKPRMDEAMKFTGSANQVLLMGDCTGKNGTLQKAIRNTFFVASQV